jgi:hypothetical protein
MVSLCVAEYCRSGIARLSEANTSPRGQGRTSKTMRLVNHTRERDFVFRVIVLEAPEDSRGVYVCVAY